MLSIIIPAWGVEDYIEECLDSIIEQEILKSIDYEIIVGIDNCIPTLDKLASIQHNYPTLKVLYMDTNKGTYITVNTLIKEAKYDYVLKFDGDDIMLPTLIETVWDERVKYDIIRFGYYYYNSKDDNSVESPRCACGVYLLHKRIFDTLGAFMPWLCSADTELLQRFEYTHFTQAKLNDEKLFYYRQHQNSLCNSPKTGMGSKVRQSYKAQYIGKKLQLFVKPVINTFKEQ